MAVAEGSTRAAARQRVGIELVVGWVLLGGLVASLTLIAVGVGWHGIATHTLRLDYMLPATNVASFVLADVRQTMSLTTGPRRLINLGIGVLLMTPYLRVLASLACFLAVERDWKYATFTAIVLATLTYGLFA